ncbi:hypothetical protein MYXO_03983 [Myxococcaceae bacterium]|nr:hypothetical protein MYXO_03983 [Myxococcaceae bacterium]
MRWARLLCLTWLACAGAARGNDLLPWDGRETAEIARELERRVAAAAAAADTSMPQSSHSQHRMRSRAMARLERLAEATGRLVVELASQQGPDRTRASFDAVVERAADVRRFVDEEKPSRKLRALWSDVEETLERLARYYPSGSPAVSLRGFFRYAHARAKTGDAPPPS